MSTTSWATVPFPALSAKRFYKHLAGLAGVDRRDRNVPSIRKVVPFAAAGWR